MNDFQLQSKLLELRAEEPEILPEIVELKMMEAFAEIEPLKRTASNKFKLTLVAAVAAILFGGLFGSAFVSPTIAQTLKGIPFMDRLFTLTGNVGLQNADQKGLLSESSYSIMKNQITVSITKVIYTGSNVSFVLQEQAEKGKRVPLRYQAIVQIDGKGAPIILSSGHTQIDELNPSEGAAVISISHSDEVDSLTGEPYSFPDTFQLGFTVLLEGMEETPFQFEIPVKKNADDNKFTPPNAEKTWNEVSLSVKSLEFTPVMTQLVVHIDNSDEADKLTEGQYFEYVIEDQSGNIVEMSKGKSGYWIPGTEVFSTLAELTPFENVPQSVIVKPYISIYKEDGTISRMYIPELEMPIEIKLKG
ncbi:DUF4179 domain-containing protein [Paenibacillus sp. IHBB 10380]|uniref:DUF4179 domain-containing protein n=1 Tax=Paenibacillus sp. IHBB 10380 TaxID=1566358 RepID=UPI0005CFD961|nr:DUF4179 domain-containing protein [Paenibacillus sp. IHBB 10380]AJS57880.1 hypothetical protein UB51_04525 [Paenibacillus sp. IHBB 10380]